MMSNGWSWYVVALVTLNVAAMVWLLFATNKDNGVDESSSMGHAWDGIEELNNPLPRWWLGLFIITIVFSVFYLYLYPGLGNYEGSLKWTQTSQFENNLAKNREKQDAFFAEFSDFSIPTLAETPKAMETAERLFLNNCSTCHGSDAHGAVGFPNLSDDDWLYGDDVENILASITNGRAGIMPNLALKRTDAAVLAHYVQGLTGMDMTDYVKEKGQSLFIVCTACHGADGKGNQQFGAPNLTDNIWLYGSRTAEIESILLNGKQGNMPSFKTLLSDNEIKLLAAYVLSLSTD